MLVKELRAACSLLILLENWSRIGTHAKICGRGTVSQCLKTIGLQIALLTPLNWWWAEIFRAWVLLAGSLNAIRISPVDLFSAILVIGTALRGNEFLRDLWSIDVGRPKESLAGVRWDFIGLLNDFLILIKFQFLNAFYILVEHFSRRLYWKAYVWAIFFMDRLIATAIVLIFINRVLVNIIFTLVNLDTTASILLKNLLINLFSHLQHL